MEKQIEFKRKIYGVLVAWNKDQNKMPLIVDGLRQVGKSFIVSKFANETYANVITYDFRHNKVLRKIFDGNLDVDSIIRNSAPYFPDKNFEPHKTILIFEEIGDCPLARTSLKSFAQDNRFTVIATGSLLGILNYRKKQKIDIPTGYEQIIQMSSLDFEEFLWANGVKEENVEILKEYAKKKEELPTALADFYKEMVKRYVVIGGMPGSLKEFLKTNNYIKSREYLERLISEYRTDFGRFINENNEEQIDYKLQVRLNQIIDSIPSQLAREKDTNKFKYSEIKHGGRSSEFEEPFEWLDKAGLVLRCFNLRAIEKPLEANADKTYFKAFISDIGLLMAMYPLSTSQEFLRDDLDSRKGAIFENLAATMIKKSNLPLYYFSSGSDHIEIDYIFESKNGIVLLEEKSINGKMAASRAVMEGRTNYKAETCYKVIQNNFGHGAFYTTIPQYALPFLLDEIAFELKKGVEFKPLKYPGND
jgi:predicted AAA+ superfamily ATPase